MFKSKEQKEQLKAVELGLTDNPERRMEDHGKPTPREKMPHECTVEGCYETKAPGQTYVCQKHVRTN